MKLIIVSQGHRIQFDTYRELIKFAEKLKTIYLAKGIIIVDVEFITTASFCHELESCSFTPSLVDSIQDDPIYLWMITAKDAKTNNTIVYTESEMQEIFAVFQNFNQVNK